MTLTLLHVILLKLIKSPKINDIIYHTEYVPHKSRMKNMSTNCFRIRL